LIHAVAELEAGVFAGIFAGVCGVAVEVVGVGFAGFLVADGICADGHNGCVSAVTDYAAAAAVGGIAVDYAVGDIVDDSAAVVVFAIADLVAFDTAFAAVCVIAVGVGVAAFTVSQLTSPVGAGGDTRSVGTIIPTRAAMLGVGLEIHAAQGALGEAFIAVVVAYAVGADLSEVATLAARAAVGEVRGYVDLAAGLQIVVAIVEAFIAAADAGAFGARGVAVCVIAARVAVEWRPAVGILVGEASCAGVSGLKGGGRAARSIDGAVAGFELVLAVAVSAAGVGGARQAVIACVGAAITRGPHAAVGEAAQIPVIAEAAFG